jgi:hypothetical protein
MKQIAVTAAIAIAAVAVGRKLPVIRDYLV